MTLVTLVPASYLAYSNDDASRTGWNASSDWSAPNSITMLDSTHKQVTIQRLDPSEAQWTLGVRLAPDGNMETELAYLVDTAKAWQQKMKNS